MKLLGVKMMIVSNAVGGLNPSYKVGDLMLVRDHINFLGLAGESPLRGPNDVNFGPRFFSVNDLYEEKWRNIAKEAAEQVRKNNSLYADLKNGIELYYFGKQAGKLDSHEMDDRLWMKDKGRKMKDELVLVTD